MYTGLKKIHEFELQALSGRNYKIKEAINEMLQSGWIMLAVHERKTFLDGTPYVTTVYILGAYQDLPIPEVNW